LVGKLKHKDGNFKTALFLVLRHESLTIIICFHGIVGESLIQK